MSRDEAAVAPDGVDRIAELAAEVAGLRDLFHRRLLDDRIRRELYDKLYAELEFARGGVVREHLAPLARELLLVVDGIDAALREGARSGLPADAAAAAGTPAGSDGGLTGSSGDGAELGPDIGPDMGSALGAAAARLAPVREQILEILFHHGVRPLAPTEDFDPLRHEAIATVPCEAGRDGKITEVRRTGYTIDDRLLRPVQVYVGRHSDPAGDDPLSHT